MSISITLENIDNILKEQGPIAIIDHLWWSVDIYNDYQTYQNDLAQFTPEQCNVFAMEWYFAEVYNGGHYQFWTNSTGIVWKEALAGFKMIGFTAGIEIMEKSQHIFGEGIPFDREQREHILDQLGEENSDLFAELENLFSKNEHLYEELVNQFIRNHKEKFIFTTET